MRSMMKLAAGLLAVFVLPLLVMAQSQPNDGAVFPLVITPTVTPEGFTGIPSSRMPTNGLWVAEAFGFETSGSCIVPGGDNDGPGAGYDPFEQEGNPVCGFADVPYIIVENARQEYLTGSDSVYAALDRLEGQVITDNNGATTGSVVRVTRKTYQVLAPDLIRVTITMQEEGGCTMTASYNLMLKTPDDLVCEAENFNEQVFLPLSTATPTPTPDPINGDPTLYIVTEPFENDMTACTEANMVPQFAEAHIRFNSPLEMVIDYGDGQATLYLAGDDYYSYNSGVGSEREDITMFPLDNGWSLGWSKRADSDICRWDVNLVRPGDLTDEIIPEEEATTDSGSTDTGLVEVMEGAYTMAWMDEYMATLCVDELKAKSPDFESARVTITEDGDALMSFEDGEFALDYMPDEQFYVLMSAPYGEGSVFVSLAGYKDGTAYLSYQMTFASGETCLRSAQLIAK